MSSSSSSPSIFILGATGYIGGTVLSDVLKAYPESKVTVQYRQDAHKEVLEKFSKQIEPVKASLSDASLLTTLAAQADVVINCADCDDLVSTSALIQGLEQAAEGRIANKQSKAVYLHTSGTGELCDPNVPLGELDETVYDDLNLEQIVAMPESRDHRVVTNKVIEAFERGHFLGYVILPSTIYGPGTGPLNRLSQQIPNVINYALTTGRATYVSPGLNIWSNVHIRSLSQLYTSLLSLLLSPSAPPPPQTGHGFEHYVLATSTAAQGTHSWKKIAETVGDYLKEMGELKEGGAVGKEGAKVTGTNSVGLSGRAKQLVGWEDTESVWDWLRADTEDTVRKFKEGKGGLKTNWGN
ncbi:hypothetical protein BDY24DRAFT_432899 [Mrakia frigida]|uniref:uncharacterized protein n=1 Tax=Mrakia frigida TaxID=29902 RepID=UPI003FCC208E